MRCSAEGLARMLLRSGPRDGPLHRRLSEGLAELIDLGELPPGAGLPSERSLAEAMNVSRTTVVTAYRVLDERGLLARRRGSGTRVAGPMADADRETVSATILRGDDAGTSFLGGGLSTIDFCTAALPCLDLVPEVAASLSAGEWEELGAEHPGYHPRGLPRLRDRIAETYTAAGVPTSGEQILVTSGAQQAMELVTLGCLRPGDDVVLEAPTYRGAVEAFSLANCRLQAVACDEHGLQVERVEKIAADYPPRLVYVQSCVHNPTGAILGPDRRRRLARLAERHRLIVVDDTALAGTVLTGSPASPLAAVTDSERVLTIGSMSKLFWSGLRLGWIRASAQVVSRLARMKGITDLGTSLVSQQIAIHLLERLPEARTARQNQLNAGLADLTGLLSEYLPDWTWQTPRGGASLWVTIPVDSVTNFAHTAQRFGVTILPGDAFGAEDTFDTHTRLPYAIPRARLLAGVQRLARAWHTYDRRTTTGPPAQAATIDGGPATLARPPTVNAIRTTRPTTHD